MKVLIIGATGHVGQFTTTEALRAGHEVRAFGRSIGKIEDSDPKLTKVKGDVTVQADVDGAVEGQDAVILTFGAPLTRDTILHQPSLCEDGTKVVVKAMKEHGVPLLIAQTSLGAGDSDGHGRFVFRNLIEPVMLGRIMKDRTAQEEVVRSSNLPQWLIVRPTELADGDSLGDVRVIHDLENEPEPGTITRADVARFLVASLAQRGNDGTAITITN